MSTEVLKNIERERDSYKHRMDLANQQLKIEQQRVKELENSVRPLIAKINALENDNKQVRDVMSINLTDSNSERQRHLKKIKELKEKLEAK